MSIENARVAITEFDPTKDKIALMLNSFMIKKTRGLRIGRDRKYSEPYFLGVTMTEQQFNAKEVCFSTEAYPRTRNNQVRKFVGNGLRIYGPETPGEFVVFNILVMESDQDVREAGAALKAVLDSPVLNNAILPLFAADPTIGAASKILKEVCDFVAASMMENKDDKLHLSSGSLFRDIMGATSLPYKVGEKLADGNDFVEFELEVLPIARSSKHRKESQTKKFGQ